MNRVILLLFAIPVVTILAIAIFQFVDEMTRKKFVLERRQRAADEATAAGAPRRRYSDSVPPGTLRNPETASSSAAKTEVTVPQVHGA